MGRSENTGPEADTLPSRVATLVDVGTRSDLRCRIAETIERLAKDSEIEPGSRLPSTRTFANVLRVHRNTVRAAIDLLVDRGVVEPIANGRFRMAAPAARIPAEAGDNVAALLGRAAELSIQHGEAEADFVAIARATFRTIMGDQRRRVCFIAPKQPVPGIGADELAGLLDYPVSSIALEDVRPSPQSIFVATTADAAAARERLDGHSDVFTVGLSLDADLRLAVAPLDPGSLVVVSADAPITLGAVEACLRRMRPDLEIEGYVGPAPDLPGDARLLLAPVGLELARYSAPVARYRCTITEAELRLIRTRLGKGAAPAPNRAHSAIA